MDTGLKRGLHWGGTALALGGVAFVAERLMDYSSALDFGRVDILGWSAGLSFVYGLSNLMLALAWWHLLAHFGASTTRQWAVKAYGISQMAKYVPGNIFHFAGRQAIGLAEGIGGWPLAKSSVGELAFMSITACVFGLLVLPLAIPDMPELLNVFIFVAVMSCSAGLLWRFIGISAAHAFGWYIAFLLVSGIIFSALLALLSDNSVQGEFLSPLLIGAYVLAWLAGFLTPGAPAGIGIRELVLLSLLQDVIPDAELLLAIVLGRSVTIVGDAWFFATAALIKGKARNAIS